MEYVITTGLDAQIRAIKRLEGTAKKAIFEIAWRLKIIADSDDFAKSGYKNIVEFAEDNLGYARSTTLNYVRIARTYLECREKSGHKQIHTICIHDDGQTQPKDYAIGQLNALGKTPAEDFRMLDSEGVINPDMSATSIKQAIKDYFSQDEPDPAPEPEPDPEPEEPEQVTEPTYTLTLQQILTSVCSPLLGMYYSDMVNEDITIRRDIINSLTGGSFDLSIKASDDDDPDKTTCVACVLCDRYGGEVIAAIPNDFI